MKKTYVYRLPTDAEALEREHGMTKPDGWIGEETIVDNDRSGKSVVVKPGPSDKDMFITCVIDRSGSMESVIGDAIGGLNAFIAEQKKDARKHGGTTRISFVMFDDYIERPYTNADLSMASVHQGHLRAPWQHWSLRCHRHGSDRNRSDRRPSQ
jgi:hypothetical protein